VTRHADESQHPFSAALVLLAFLARWRVKKPQFQSLRERIMAYSGALKF
jgi:hypothetical protein